MDLKSKATNINNKLSQYLPPITNEYGNITEAMSYSVLNGGKRVRAVMLVEAFSLFSQDSFLLENIVYPFAAALECIHAYSLVHDDLPSMDNDLYRRGQLTTHAKYGHAMGVLTGDALLNYAMELVATTMNKVESFTDYDTLSLYRRCANAISLMFTKAGYSGMIGGQVLDINGLASDDLEEQYQHALKLYELKTSRLFEVAVCVGGILSGASEEQIEQLSKFALNLGIAFQVRDDVLDITSTVEELGKDVGNDADNNKQTVPAIIGMSNATLLVKELSDNAIAALNSLNCDTSFFKELTDFMITRKK